MLPAKPPVPTWVSPRAVLWLSRPCPEGLSDLTPPICTEVQMHSIPHTLTYTQMCVCKTCEVCTRPVVSVSVSWLRCRYRTGLLSLRHRCGGGWLKVRRVELSFFL